MNQQLPPLKLPSLFQSREDDRVDTTEKEDAWPTTSTLYNKEEYYNHNNNFPTVFNNHDYYKMSTTTDILLPPILTNPIQQITTNPPSSPPYSTCSVSSSLPSSPSSSSGNSFSSFSSSYSTTATSIKKNSIQSLLNSGTELLELERKKQHYFDEEKKNNKKKRIFHNDDSTTTNKKKKIGAAATAGDYRQMKGLRLFSKQVCDKVAEKKKTTYNEVADELAADILRNNNNNNNTGGIDQKNIRRRVYDALNVLMALNLITKDRKEIKWLGIQENNTFSLEQEIKNEELRHQFLMDSIKNEKTTCNNTWIHLNRLKQLVKRNQQQQQTITNNNNTSDKIQLPFFLIQGQDIIIHRSSINMNDISLTSSNLTTIYKDFDILSNICPSSPNPTTATTTTAIVS